MARLGLTTLLVAAIVTIIHAVGLPASAHQKRVEEIAHDAVKPFPENAGEKDVGKLVMKYKPFLKVIDGCVPFPAVNAQGQTSGGLQDTGSMNGGCSKSTGQVYARIGAAGNRLAVMYAWYFPKDMTLDGGGSTGHRHDWEEIVVFVQFDLNFALKGISYSGHGKYPDKVPKSRLDSGKWLDGSRPKVEYSRPGLVTHRVSPTNEKGGTQPVIEYEKLTKAAKDGLRDMNWKDAVCPFCDADTFQRKLDLAWSDSYG